MRYLLLIIVLTLSSNLKADWVEYSTRVNGDVYYFDDARVQKNGSRVTVWNRARYKTSVMAAFSYQSQIVIDCATYSVATTESTFYLDKDWLKPAMATDSTEKPWVSIDAESAIGELANKLCKE